MPAGAILHRPRRTAGAPVIDPGGGGNEGNLPTVQARWSDLVPQNTGVNVKLATGGYQNNGPNYPALPGEVPGERAVREALLELGVRHYRDIIGSNNNANQTAQMNRLAEVGINGLLLVGKANGSMGTVDQIMARAEVLDPRAIFRWSGSNEWNLPVSGGSYEGWWTDATAWQQRIWQLRNGYPVNSTSLGRRQGYSTLGNQGAFCTHGDTHHYVGNLPLGSRIEEVTSQHRQYVTPGKLCDVTETGFNTADNYTGSHWPFPEDIAAIYYDRLVMDHFRHPNVSVMYGYQLFDNARNDAKNDAQAHFGLCAWDAQASPSWRRKLHFTAVSRLLQRCKDQSQAEIVAGLGGNPTTYTPAPLPMVLTGGGADLRWVLLGKRDGSYLLVMWRDVVIYTANTTGGIRRTPPAPVTMTLTTNGATVTRYRPSNAAGSVGTTTGKIHTQALAERLIVLHIQPD